MRDRYLLLTAVVIGMAVAPARAAALVDTGTPPEDGRGAALFNAPDRGFHQWLGGYITLTAPATIGGIDGYFYGYGSGIVTVALYGDGVLPGPSAGDALFSASFAKAITVGGAWQGVSGLAWTVAAGSYWVSFETAPIADGGTDTALHTDAPSPLARYAFTNEFPAFYAWNRDDRLGLGIRVFAAVPEPESWALLIAGFGLVGGALRRRRQHLPA